MNATTRVYQSSQERLVANGAMSIHGNQVDIENVVRQTTNYRMFRFDLANRPINQDHLEHLYDSVERRNLLHLYPIVVDESMTVIDGQHRLKVAEALGVPIFYVVTRLMSIEDAGEVIGATRRWTPEDWLHHWCALGKSEYIAVREFWQRHQWLKLSMVMHMCFYGDRADKAGDRRSLTRRWQNGTYVANDIPFAEQVCAMAKDFSSWIPHWKHSSLLYALHNLASNANYDHRRMIQKMQYLSTRLVKCPDMTSYIAVINDIYNYRVREDEKVALVRLNPSSPLYRVDRKQGK